MAMTFNAGVGVKHVINIHSFCSATSEFDVAQLVRIERRKNNIKVCFNIALQSLHVTVPHHGSFIANVENFREKMHKMLSDKDMCNMDAKKINEICDFVEVDFKDNKELLPLVNEWVK